MRASKHDDGLEAVESKLKQLSSVITSIEQQLDHLEDSRKRLIASSCSPELDT